MSFFWMATWNATVRSRIKWLGGGGGSLAVVEESGEVGGPSLLFRVASRLQRWLIGVQQIMHFCCEQGEVLVQVLGVSWQGVSVSVLVSVSAAGSMLNSSRLN